jgi:hypothetical protein
MYDLSTPTVDLVCTHDGYTSKVLLDTVNLCTVTVTPENNSYSGGFTEWTTHTKQIRYTLETSVWKCAPDDCEDCITNVIEETQRGSVNSSDSVVGFSFVWVAPSLPEPDVQGLLEMTLNTAWNNRGTIASSLDVPVEAIFATGATPGHGYDYNALTDLILVHL